MTEYYVATDGDSGNNGLSILTPWDIASALENTADVGAGDTIWIRGGTYVHPDRTPGDKGYQIKLIGAEGSPIWVKPYLDERPIIDGGLHTDESAVPSHFRLYGLEVIVSECLAHADRITTEPGSGAPSDLEWPWGGIVIRVGHDVGIINLIVHGCMEGIGFWKHVGEDSEVYGCLVYDNGWIGPDGGHGHGIYTQQLDELEANRKWIRNNIFFDNWGERNINGYGEADGVFVSILTIENNIAFEAWRYPTIEGVNGGQGACNLGSNNEVSTGLEVNDNVIMGYPQAGLIIGAVQGATGATITGNWVIGSGISIDNAAGTKTDNIEWKCQLNTRKVDGVGEGLPGSAAVKLVTNAYDDRRLHIAVISYAEDENFPANVDVDFSSFLSEDDTYELFYPGDIWGTPLLSGTYAGGTLSVPMESLPTGIFYMTREAAAPAGAGTIYTYQQEALPTIGQAGRNIQSDGPGNQWLPGLGPDGSALFDLGVGRANKGTLTGMDLVADSVLGDPRTGGHALNFNGSTGTVPFARTMTFTGPFTLLMYFRLSSGGFSGFDNMIWGHGNSNYIRPNGNATLFQIRVGPTYEFTLDDALVVNTWYSLAFTRNLDDLVTMYVDGVPQADTETVTEDVVISRIGSKRAGANFMDGQIATAGIWGDRALLVGEIERRARDPFYDVRPKPLRWSGVGEAETSAVPVFMAHYRKLRTPA